MFNQSRRTQWAIAIPEEQSNEREGLAQAVRRSKLERISSIPSNNSILRTLQNKQYTSPNSGLASHIHRSLLAPSLSLVRPGQFTMSESMDPLDNLRRQRLVDYKQSVYILPMAKVSLQAPGDILFPLLSKVQAFLEGNSQVMLILGDSGAGKSTFNHHLEHRLWEYYTAD